MGEIFVVAEHRKGEVREVTYQMTLESQRPLPDSFRKP